MSKLKSKRQAGDQLTPDEQRKTYTMYTALRTRVYTVYVFRCSSKDAGSDLLTHAHQLAILRRGGGVKASILKDEPKIGYKKSGRKKRAEKSLAS
jgi:hypothetical protein